MKRYQVWFEFVDDEETAKRLVEFRNWIATPYQRKKYPPHYTSWESNDHKEHKFVVWYAI